MILQLEHQHKKKQQAPSILTSPKPQLRSISRVINQSQIVQQHLSIFYQPQPQQHETSSFNFHIDGLEAILLESSNLNPNNVTIRIQQRKKFSEDRVYQAIVNPTVNFVNLHMNEFQKGIKIQLSSMFQGIHNAVQAGIWDGRYEIDFSKNKYFSSLNKQKQLVSFITEELVKRNIDNFKQQLNDSENDYLEGSSIHPKSQNYKTKQAQDFVKKMKEYQFENRLQLQKIRKKHQQLQYQSLQQSKRNQEARRRERSFTIQSRIEKKMKKKQQQKERQKKIHLEYIKLISSKRKPLHEELQQKYHRKVVEEQKQKYKMMKEIKEKKAPISFEQINEHLMRYEQLLEESEAFRQQKRQLKQHQQLIISSRRPYRSKFYSLILNQIPKATQKQIKTSLLKRQEDYTDYVRQNYMPKIDQKKQQEIQQLLDKVNLSQIKTDHSRKYMEQGKRNLQRLHLLIAQLKTKHKTKPNLTIQELNQLNRPQQIKYPNYLQEFKNLKISRAGQEVDLDKIISDKNMDWIKLQALQKEQKAKQKQRYLDSNMQVIDIHTHMKEKSNVEKGYMQSAKAKMALLKKYNFNHQQRQNITQQPAQN